MAPRNKSRKRPGKRRPAPARLNSDTRRDSGESHDLLIAEWSRSRAGGRAARGYHFQDAVGAWLAARIATGQLTGELVPEGFDDMTVEGDPSNNHQVKSRADHLGSFPPSDAAKHIFDAWEANRLRAAPAGTVTVVLERAVASDEDLSGAARPLEDVLITGSPLQQAIARVASTRDVVGEDLSRLRRRTVVLGLTWTDLDNRIDVLLAGLASVPPAALGVLRRALYAAVARATDINGSTNFEERERLTRTGLVAAVADTAELIDVDGLEVAIRDGLCSPLRYEQDPRASDAFYEGTATQPAHVASGLVVPRPELAAQAVAAIDAGQPVVIVGPSGVGKSALAWTIPAALTGILWFNVQRVETAADANDLVRLARAHNATAEAPVGFMVDAAGIGLRTAWTDMRALTAASPGVVLLATARNEDLPTLGSLTDVATVAVDLDEHAAATIFEGLKRRGVTSARHWREAFAQANGLTLEFTHLLARGQRIDDVISEQIHTRLVEGRDDELEVLSIVAMADQWSATIEAGTLQLATGTTAFDLRRSLDRLSQEHLLVESNGVLTGLHPLRSQAITRALHATPPPKLVSTFKRTLDLVPTVQLSRYIAQALRDHPGLAPEVLDVAYRSSTEPARLASYLQGLRLADADTLVLRWIDALNEHKIRRSLRTTLVMLTVTDLDLAIFPDPVKRAVETMVAARPGTLRDDLADRLGSEQIADTLTRATAVEATALLATLDGWTATIEPAIGTDTVLAEDLAAAPIESITKLLATASGRSDRTARLVLEALGGTEALLQRLHAENPWILRAGVRNSPDGPVGYARLLHVTDHQGDAHEACVGLARHLLRIIPTIDATDVKVRGPGYTPIIIDGHEHGVTNLLRRYDHAETRVAWNQTLTKAAVTLMGASDTSRLAAAYPILCDLADLFAEVGGRWVQGKNSATRNLRLAREQIRLTTAAGDLPPPIGRTTVGDNSIDRPETVEFTDPLSTIVTDLTENLFVRLSNNQNPYALASFLRGTVEDHIGKARNEPWHLIPEGDKALEHLATLGDLAWELHDVLKAMHDDADAERQILNTARTGSWKHALGRAAEIARKIIDHHAETRRAQFETAIRRDNPGYDINVLSEFRDGLTDLAVSVEVPSLLQWDETELVASIRRHGGELEQIVVIPLRQGRPVEGVGVRIGRNTDLPLLELGGWERHLPDAHPAELGALVRAANDALQFRSGLADLDEARREHPAIEPLLNAALDRLDAAIRALEARGTDAFSEHVLVDLNELVERVKAELSGQWQGPTYAHQLLRRSLGDNTDEGRDAIVRYLAALEWEIDPQRVRDLLDW